ncbi:MAG: cell division ATP-binding protein FtsE [Acidobacteriota bacterium]
MISFHHVSKRYGPHIGALNDVTFSVEKGEFVFITGPSGAGKTTLLRLIFRGETPTEGQILVDGKNVTAIPDSRIPYIRRTIGVVFQDFKLIERKDVLDNVSYVLRILGISSKEMRRKAYNALRIVGLNHRLHQYPKMLSGGEQQRVAIARAIANEPMILLADEPTGNLDPDLALEIMQLFKDINARGTTIIVATHDRDLVRRMNKRAILIEKGRILEDRKVAI